MFTDLKADAPEVATNQTSQNPENTSFVGDTKSALGSAGSSIGQSIASGTLLSKADGIFTRVMNSITPATKSVKDVAEWVMPSVTGFGETLGSMLSTGSIRNINVSNVKEADALWKAARASNLTKSRDAKYRLKLLAEQGMDTQNALDDESLSAMKKSNWRILGESLGTLGWLTAGGAPKGVLAPFTTSYAGRLGYAGLRGALTGAQSDFMKDKPENALLDAALSSALSIILQGGVEYALGKIAKPASTAYEAALKPDKSGNASILEQQALQTQKGVKNTLKLFGEKVRDTLDDDGNAVYQGTIGQLKDQGGSEIVKNSNKLTKLLTEKYSNKVIKAGDITDDVLETLIADYGDLTDSQLSVIRAEANRLQGFTTSAQFDPMKATEAKRAFDNMIPDNFWKGETPDPAKVFTTNVRYAFRDGLRRAVNNATQDPLVQELNNRIGLGMEVRRLASLHLAADRVKGFSFETVKDTLLNSWYTTRFAQQAIRPTTATRIIPLMLNED